MSDIFLSHSSLDRKVARLLCESLENRGFGCWIAERDVGPGENFQAAIVHAIRSAKAMVLVFSDNANNSDEIKKEMALAGQSRLIVIPARVEDVTPDAAFAYELAIRQWVDLFEDWERAIQRLVRQLEAATGPRSTAPTDGVEPAKRSPVRDKADNRATASPAVRPARIDAGSEADQPQPERSVKIINGLPKYIYHGPRTIIAATVIKTSPQCAYLNFATRGPRWIEFRFITRTEGEWIAGTEVKVALPKKTIRNHHLDNEMTFGVIPDPDLAS
jgi:hypothetical protein